MISKKLGKELLKFMDKVEHLVLIQPTKKIEAEDKKYSQVWSAYNEAQTNEKTLFINILLELNSLLDVEYRKRRGRPNSQLQDMVFACALKVYSGHSSRRAVSELQLLKEKGYILEVPHFNTLVNYFNEKDITSILKRLVEFSSLPLKQVEENFTVDSSGFSTSVFSRWFDHKYGEEKDHRIWRKAHLISGVKTNIVCSVEITEGNASDTTQFPALLEQTAKNFTVKEVSADKAYSSRKNLQLASDIGAVPYIPFKSGSTAKRHKHEIWKKMFEYFILNREKFLEHYHKRSNAESVFHMIKTKFGNSLNSKTYVGQTNEILLKVLCHNICVLIQEMHELGIEVNYCAENYPAQKIVI
jgi:transposase